MKNTSDNSRKKQVLLAGNLFFYMYWDYRFLALLIISITVDFLCAQKIELSTEKKYKRFYLLISLVVNLGLLGFFKYYNFFIDSLNIFIGGSLNNLDIILPIGISFYTFQTMSYTIDVYRGRMKPENNFINFAIYVSFFPQLIAGPIVRARSFLPQLQRDILLTRVNFEIGLQIFVYGLFKKVVMADRLGYYVDTVLASYPYYSGLTLFLIMLCFSVQIYCDFSGYSDMAIGLGQILGFKLPVNFKLSSTSKNINEFWMKWHITLSTWLRDYLFIPLYNVTGRKYKNICLFITMVLCGLWHGAGLNFLFWGAYLGLWQVIYQEYCKRYSFRFPAPIAWLITYLMLNICGLFFRISDFSAIFDIIKAMVTLKNGIAWYYPPVLPILLIYIFGTLYRKKHNEAYPSVNINTYVGSFAVVFIIFAIFFLSPTEQNPFIYFQF